MDLQHPTVTEIIQKGYPFSDRQEEYGVDGLGNEVFCGDDILVLDDEFYLVEELFAESIEVLENHGAKYAIAK